MRGINHDCNKCEEQIASYLDGAFSQDQERQFFSSVNACPRCTEKLEKEKSFKVFLKKKMPVAHASRDLISNIRSRIHSDNGFRKD